MITMLYLSSKKNYSYNHLLLLLLIIVQSFSTTASKNDLAGRGDDDDGGGGGGAQSHCYTSIVSFGDSLTDTGNILNLPLSVTGRGQSCPCALPPYGETFFHHPTGRSSDGRLILDFIAERLGIPYVPPYIGGNVNSRTKFQGVNFAVAGGSALDTTFLDQIGLSSEYRNVSLRVQVGWFRQFLHHLCPITDCNEQLRNSLIFMGDTGGVDYAYSLRIGGRSIEETRPLTPLVVNAMISAISEIIELGGVTLLVPGNFPLGCLAAYLALFQDSDREEDYDPVTGCHVPLNKFVENHNDLLQRELIHLQQLHPDVNIIYVDFYHSSMELFRSPKHNGFYGGALRACCGAGGPYNVIPSIPCGYPLSTVCDNPDLYVNWDGPHLTEKAYHWIFKRLFVDGPYTIPRFNISCFISGLGRGELISQL